MDLIDGARLRLSKPVLEFGEGLLDGIEIRAVGRQEEAVRASGADRFPHGLSLVAAKIVEDDDISRSECWEEELFGIGEELLAVDRPVEDAGRIDPVDPERGEEGQCPPAAVRRSADQALAATAPAPERRHIGFDPGLVNEHQAARVYPGLPRLPSHAAASDVGPLLLTGVCGFF